MSKKKPCKQHWRSISYLCDGIKYNFNTESNKAFKKSFLKVKKEIEEKKKKDEEKKKEEENKKDSHQEIDDNSIFNDGIFLNDDNNYDEFEQFSFFALDNEESLYFI